MQQDKSVSRVELEALAVLLVQDLASIGIVTHAPRLSGFALFDDGVMFAFIEQDGTLFMRASRQSAQRFHALGSVKHPEMPYWSVPYAATFDLTTLQELAYEAADIAHIAVSFGIDDNDDVMVQIKRGPLRPLRRLAGTWVTMAA